MSPVLAHFESNQTSLSLFHSRDTRSLEPTAAERERTLSRFSSAQVTTGLGSLSVSALPLPSLGCLPPSLAGFLPRMRADAAVHPLYVRSSLPSLSSLSIALHVPSILLFFFCLPPESHSSPAACASLSLPHRRSSVAAAVCVLHSEPCIPRWREERERGARVPSLPVCCCCCRSALAYQLPSVREMLP